jgi:hypothetical protein
VSQHDIPAEELFHELDNIVEVKLRVPEAPTVYDLAVTYRKIIQQRLEMAQESVLDTELNVANAQRIALASRARVASLQEQLDKLDRQIDTLVTFA